MASIPRRLAVRQGRGSALLLVVVLLAILATVGLGLALRTTREGDSAAAKRQHDKAVSCADSARQMLLSQFQLYGAQPTSLTLNSPVDDKVMSSGHYDTFNVTSVQLASGVNQGSEGIQDISNRVVRTALGAQFYRMTVVCSSAGNTRQSEVEFLVRFGL